MSVGLRVVRGPDWQWGDQDGGKGHVGTIVDIDREGHDTVRDKMVKVTWDSGNQGTYRVGFQNAYDLRILDTAQIGTTHSTVMCDFCQESGLEGMRWKCSVCHDYDLCSRCYMSDKHDLTHPFLRFASSSNSTPVLQRANSKSERIQAFGVFPGATVCRGPDWDWGNQDGGAGKTGTVTSFKPGNGRCVVEVKWESGTTNIYRMGHKGKVDLIYKQAAEGWRYYQDHLPVLGADYDLCHFKAGDKVRCDLEVEIVEQLQKGHGEWASAMRSAIGKTGVVKRVDSDGDLRVAVEGREWAFNPLCMTVVTTDEAIATGITNTSGFKVMDKVRCDLDVELIKQMQEGHGGWVPGMEKYIKKVGRIHSFTSAGNVKVQYDVTTDSFVYNPVVLTKVDQFNASDKVKVDASENRVKELQDGHGNWVDPMKNALGKTGEVKKVLLTGDLRVEVEGNTWTFNPQCCTLLSNERARRNEIKVGDKVRCELDIAILTQMQEGHGGWAPSMGKYINEVGTVNSIEANGDMRVQYCTSSKNWVLNPDALTKVFETNDQVKISENIEQVKKWQNGHGEWTDAMKKALGQTGEVKKVEQNGDLCVAVADHQWKLNPLCCTLVTHHGGDDGRNSILDQSDEEDSDSESSFSSLLLLKLLVDAMVESSECEPHEQLIAGAAKGDADIVKEVLSSNPDCVDNRKDGRTALHVACFFGHKEVVKLLLDAGASLTVKDNDGDTPVHLTAYSNKLEVMILLLLSGKANVDAQNNSGQTTLHIAAGKQHVDCVKVLIQWDCNVNIQNSSGDLALHDAVSKDFNVIEALIDYTIIDFAIVNKRGFNVLHWAALKDDALTTAKIVEKCPEIVNIKKNDGFSPLHLAALNGHKNVAVALLLSNADIDIRNNDQLTPLHLAMTKGYASVIEELVSQGANIKLVDERGNTCLHLAAMKTEAAEEDEGSPKIDAICSQLQTVSHTKQKAVAIMCFLAQQGAELEVKNNDNKTPLDIIDDADVKELIKLFAITAQPRVEEQMSVNDTRECRVCMSQSEPVIFEPCGHSVACVECCSKMRRCIRCQQFIENKKTRDGTIINSEVSTPSEEATLRERLQELEDEVLCTICMESRRNCVFQCGHGTCQSCAERLQQCPTCREPIQQRINTF